MKQITLVDAEISVFVIKKFFFYFVLLKKNIEIKF